MVISVDKKGRITVLETPNYDKDSWKTSFTISFPKSFGKLIKPKRRKKK